MNNLQPLERKLRIETNALKRYKNEYVSYKNEKLREVERIEQMKLDNASDLRLKQQKNVIEETKKMLPIIKNKLNQQKNLLIEFLNENQDKFVGLNGSEILSTHNALNDLEAYLIENN